MVTTTLSRLTTGFSCPDCCLGVSSSCAITNVAKIVVKRYLQKGWYEPASGKNNGLSDRCESVGVLLSEGGNTSAYLATQRYRSMPLLPSVCHFLHRTDAAYRRTTEQQEGSRLSCHCRFGCFPDCFSALILPSVHWQMGWLCNIRLPFSIHERTGRSSRMPPLNGWCR